jgi:hypothetical protein
MFDHVVLRRAEGEVGVPVSAGQIAEALLYYQHVHLVIDQGTLIALIAQLGPQRLLSLLQRSDFSAVYTEEILGIYTEPVGSLQVHRCVAVALSGHHSTGPLHTIRERLQYTVERHITDKKAARTFVEIFLERVPARKFSRDHFLPGGIPEAAKRDLLDAEFTKAAVRQILNQVAGGYDAGADLAFEVIDSDLGLHVFHNIDLDGINQRRATLQPVVEPLTIAFVLSQIQEARADLVLASFYGGDFVTSRLVSSVIQIRHEELLRRSAINRSSHRQFAEVVLPDTPTLAEVIDSGERTFDEFIALLGKADRFKHWLKSVNPDEGVVITYLHDVASEGWIQKLPAKTARYIMTTALGATNPVSGIASGFVDTFLVEKLLSGWRPNHFISRRLRPFVDNN